MTTTSLAAACGSASAPAWLHTVRASPAVAALRADSARTVLEVAALLALAARADGTSSPTWRVLVERSGYSRATVARVLAWLHRAQLLVTVKSDACPQLYPTPPAVQNSQAAVYLLTNPSRGHGSLR